MAVNGEGVTNLIIGEGDIDFNKRTISGLCTEFMRNLTAVICAQG